MKSRLVILTMLVAGLLMAGTGAGLAVSGISGSGDAGVAQYLNGTTEDDGEGDVGGEEETGDDGNGGVDDGEGGLGPSGGTGGDGNGGEVLGASEAGDADQAAQQGAAGEDDELPFTGLMAIPLLLVGVGLLAGGLVAQRRLRVDG